MQSSQQIFQQVIAIDGPAASGKSSVARELARRIGFVYVNSGAIYRAITWHILQQKIQLEDTDRIARDLESLAVTSCLRDAELCIMIDNIDPAGHLRDNRVNENVSRVSRLPMVRQIVGRKLHEYASTNDLVVEGRDIGSVVFPNTPYKFYVDASPEVRLQRRAAQGERDEIALRDHADFSRPVSPLVIAKDAHVIDTSHLTIEKVIDRILTRLRETGLRSSQFNDLAVQ
jgi:cytidylate kinase